MLTAQVGSRTGISEPFRLAMAPADFGKFSGDLLVGNFGDGRMHALAETSTATGRRRM